MACVSHRLFFFFFRSQSVITSVRCCGHVVCFRCYHKSFRSVFFLAFLRISYKKIDETLLFSSQNLLMEILVFLSQIPVQCEESGLLTFQLFGLRTFHIFLYVYIAAVVYNCKRQEMQQQANGILRGPNRTKAIS